MEEEKSVEKKWNSKRKRSEKKWKEGERRREVKRNKERDMGRKIKVRIE